MKLIINLRRLRAALGPGVFLIIGVLLLCAFQWFAGKRNISQIDENINQLTQEKARLSAIIHYVDEQEVKIEELKERQAQFDRMAGLSSKENFQKEEE